MILCRNGMNCQRRLSVRVSLLFIDPDPCIDCQACIPECPVQAIYYEDDVPEPWREYIALNREMAPQCPQITEKRNPSGPAAGLAS